MKKRIGIIGSTGSIGKSLLSIIHKKNYEIVFLAAKKNHKLLINQAKRFNVKNIILTDYRSFKYVNKKFRNFKVFKDFKNFRSIIEKKLDYVMSSISGIEGLLPTFEIIKFTKKIAIANKESLVCAWPLLQKELNKYKTKFIPVDSEHFSIWSEIKDLEPSHIKKVYLTASGGPLLNLNRNSIKKINLKDVLKHPTWKMGKKISVDSATMMNKCYEVMEAKNIFNLSYKQIGILLHPDSYVHAIIELNNGITKIILHETTMKIPIFNTINDKEKYAKLLDLDIKKVNNPRFQKVKVTKYPIIKILKKLKNKHSLFDTVIISINDIIVNSYLENKIEFNSIAKLVLKYSNLSYFRKYRRVYPKKISEIIELNNVINIKLNELLKKKNYENKKLY